MHLRIDSSRSFAFLFIRATIASLTLSSLAACGGGGGGARSVGRPALRSELTVGEERSLDDPRLGPEMAQLGIYHAGIYVRSAAPGLHLLGPHEPARTPVIFVHGYGGHPQQLSTLIQSIDETRYEPWIYQYPSGWRIERSARSLDAGLEALRERYDLREVRIVAHSMGGVVARTALRQREERGAAPLVSSLITLASPLGGMPSAAEGARRSPMVIASWIDLDPDSALVHSLARTPLPERTRWVLVSTDDGGGEGDGTVSLTHQLPPACVADADRLEQVQATHTGVLASPAVFAILREELGASS